MTWITLALCGLLLSIAIVRLALPTRNRTTGAWAFLQIAVLISLAKLARTPNLADKYFDPPLQRWTGLTNLMTLAGMTLGALTVAPAVVLMAALLQYRPRVMMWLAAQGGIAGGMILTFVVSPIPHTPSSSYITASVPTPWSASVWIYWGIFLGVIGVAATVNLVLARRALAVISKVPAAGRNKPFWLTLLGWGTTAAFADLYVINKIVNIYLTGANHTHGWYMTHVQTISLVLLLVVVVAAAVALLVQPVCLLPGRVERFLRLYRDVGRWREAREHNPNFALPGVSVPATNFWSLWRAAAAPFIAASLRVELADAAAAAVDAAANRLGEHE